MKHSLLTTALVNDISAPGYHLDGVGLYLQVSKAGTKSWVFRYQRAGRVRDMGLGPAGKPPAITLAEARKLAMEARTILLAGDDPLDLRQAKKDAAKVDIPFKVDAEQYIELREEGW